MRLFSASTAIRMLRMPEGKPNRFLRVFFIFSSFCYTCFKKLNIKRCKMYKTIGILAHVDSGKTTFSEQLLFPTHSIRQRGRVDHQDTFLDSHEIEKNRGITIFADQALFQHGDSTYYLIDT